MLDLGTAVGYLMLDTSGFRTGFSQANTYLRNFLDRSNDLSTRLSSLEKGLTSIGTKMTVGVSLPLLGAGTAMVHFAAESENALKKFKAQVGETSISLEKYKSIMDDIYKSNYGESYEDVADSMATIVKLMGEMNPLAMQKATESALTIRDTLGYDVPESIRAANALMKNFGLTAEEAFDFIVKGNQEGLDYSNELLDTISEYSVQFKKVGFDANDMFNIMKQGAETGAWNLDKVGDAIKEFSIRSIDSSESTISAFEKLGLSYEDIGERFAAGGDIAKGAFSDTISAIESIQDPLEQDMIGVALFGTMWEDLGKEVVFQMGNISNEAVNMSGAMDTLKETRFDTLEGSIGNLWRTIQSAGASLGENFIPVVNNFAKGIQGLVDGFNNLDPYVKDFITNTGLALAIMGPMLLVAGKITGAINSGIAAYQSLKTALTAATAAQTGLNAAMSANVIGLVVTAVGGLVAVLTSFGLASALTSTEVSKLTDEIEESRSAYQELSNEIEENNQNTMDMVASLEALVAKENKTVSEKQAIKQLVADLNESVPELSLAYDEQTNSLNMTTEAIKAAAKAEYDRAKQQAVIERISEAYTEQIRIAEQLEEAQALLEREQKRYTEATENSTAQTSRQKDAMQAYTGALYYAQGEVDRLTKLQQENEAEIAELEGAYSGYAYVVSTDVKQASVNLINQSGREKAAINDTTEAIELKIKALLALAQADEKSAKSAIASSGLDPIKLATNTALLTKAKADIESYTKALNDLKTAKAEAENNEDDGSGTGGNTGTYGTSDRLKQELTQTEKNVKAYLEAVDELDHLRALDNISESEYYEKKGELAEKYLEKDSDEYRKYVEDRYRWDKEQQESQLEARTKAYEKERDLLKDLHEDGEISTEEYLTKLSKLQEEYLDRDSEEWANALEFRNSEVLRIQDEFKNAFTESLDTIGDRYSDAIEDVESAQKSLAEKLSDTDLFDVKDDKMFLRNIEKDIKGLELYGESLDKLKQRGISGSLLDEILGLDPEEATKYMGKLLTLTDKEFEEYNKSWEEKQELAKSIAEQFYSDQITTIQESFSSELAGALEGIPEDMKESGKDAIGSWVEGFESEFGNVGTIIQGLFTEATLQGSKAAKSIKRDAAVFSGSYAAGLDYVPRDMVVKVHEGESIYTKQQTAELANLLSGMQADNSGDLVINWYMNGIKFSQGIIHDFRTVDSSTPKVVNDT